MSDPTPTTSIFSDPSDKSSPTSEGMRLADEILRIAEIDEHLKLHTIAHATFKKAWRGITNQERLARINPAVNEPFHQAPFPEHVQYKEEDYPFYGTSSFKDSLYGYLVELLDLESPPYIELDSGNPISMNGQYRYKTNIDDKMPNTSNLNESLGHGYIVINDDIFSDQYEVVETLAHELWHDYQAEHAKHDYRAKNKPYYTDSKTSEYGEISWNAYLIDKSPDDFLNDINANPGKYPSITSSSDDAQKRELAQELYEAQAHERDARYFAAKFLDIFRKKLRKSVTSGDAGSRIPILGSLVNPSIVYTGVT